LPTSVSALLRPSRAFLAAHGASAGFTYEASGKILVHLRDGTHTLSCTQDEFEASLTPQAALVRTAKKIPQFTTEIIPVKMDNWDIKPNILESTIGGQKMGRFSWNPVTGEFIPQASGRHADMLQGRVFDDYIRGLVFHADKLVTLRVFWPSWMQSGADDEDIQVVNVEAQLAAQTALKNAGAADWNFRLNITNKALEEMTGSRFW
jgi:hypothetical protein